MAGVSTGTSASSSFSLIKAMLIGSGAPYAEEWWRGWAASAAAAAPRQVYIGDISIPSRRLFRFINRVCLRILKELISRARVGRVQSRRSSERRYAVGVAVDRLLHGARLEHSSAPNI